MRRFIVDRLEFFNFTKILFDKKLQSFGKINHGVLLLIKLLQTKPQVRNMNFNCYDVY